MIITGYAAKSQETEEADENEKLQEQIESAAEMNENEQDYSEVIENLEYYKEHPLDLNTASAIELKELIFLNDLQINNLLEYRRKYGKMYSIYELQAIDGFYLDKINEILPYVYDSYNPQKHSVSAGDILSRGKSKLIMRYAETIEKKKGFTSISDSALAANPDSRYTGSPEKLYFRYNYRYFDNLSFGITGKKDAGEEFLRGTQKNGFDFYSYHFYTGNIGKLKSFVIGDYQAELGQGLILCSGFTFYGKSTEVISVRKQSQGLRQYTSSDENRFLRGIGCTVDLNHFEISGFYSKKDIDANIAYDSLRMKNIATSLQETGLHATTSQVKDKDALQEKILGSHIAYRNKGLNIGVTAFGVQYNKEIIITPKPYNQFNFRGNQNIIAGFDYSYSIYNINFFGEAAESRNHGKAIINGILICPDSHVLLSFIYRNYSKDYQPVMSSAFSEGTENSNEEGFYAGLQIKPNKPVTISAYSDFFRSQWLKYNVNKPSAGRAYMVKLNYKQENNPEIYIIYRYRNKNENINDEKSITDRTGSDIYNNYRINIIFTSKRTLTLRNRTEYITHFTPECRKQNGFLIYQDLIYKPSGLPASLIFRYALFDTDTYDERLYAYENDVPYTYSVVPYYYKGSRFYIMLHYSLGKVVDFWIRYSRSLYEGRTSIGTGLDEIEGNKKSEIHFEFRLNF
jgi:hypothetical protein